MGRRVTGNLRERSSRFYVTFACARLSATTSFPTRAGAEAYRTATAAALATPDAPLPDPVAYGATPAALPETASGVSSLIRPSPSLTRTPFEELADHWYCIEYTDRLRAQFDRAEEVRRILDVMLLPFLRSVLGPSPIAQDCTFDIRHAFTLHLAGRGTGSASPGRNDVASGSQGGHRDENVLLDVHEAAAHAGVSKSTIDRARRSGELAGRRQDGQWRYTFGELDAYAKTSRPAAAGIAKSSASHAVWVLHSILLHARRIGCRDMPEVGAILTAVEPFDKDRKQPKRIKPKHTPMQVLLVLARQLHVVHQLCLFLARLLGLRRGEIFGICVADLLTLPTGEDVLLIERQGGRTFTRIDGNGELVTSTFAGTKTTQSVRGVVLPRQVAAMIRTAIRVFHTDPTTGEIRLDARLVPDVGGKQAGAAGFYQALSKACKAAGLELSPHSLRADLVTDLHDFGQIEASAIRRFHGHQAGTDVHARAYMKDSVQYAAQRRLAAVLTDEINDQIGEELIVPVTMTPPLFTASEFAQRWPTSREQLVAVGWIPTGSDVEDLRDAVEVADILDQHVNVVRRAMADGRLDTVTRLRNGREVRYCRTDWILAEAARRQELVTLTKLAEQRGVTYHLMHRGMRELGLGLVTDESSRIEHLTEEGNAALVAWHEELQDRQARTMSLFEASRALGVAESTARLWARDGRMGVISGDPGAQRVERSVVSALVAQNAGDLVADTEAAPLLGVPLEVIRFFVSTGAVTCRRARDIRKVSLEECRAVILGLTPADASGGEHVDDVSAADADRAGSSRSA